MAQRKLLHNESIRLLMMITNKNLNILLIINLFVIACLVYVAHGFAQQVDVLSYDGVLDKSDSVIIAKPISQKTLNEQISILSNTQEEVPVIGLETQLSVEAVLKGTKLDSVIILHHYKLLNDKISRVIDVDNTFRYLFFLHRDRDGRYSPAGGQYLPRSISIKRLD